MSLDNDEFPLLTVQELRTAEAPQLYRPHAPVKPKTFDWDALTPTCRDCGNKTGQVNALNGLCPSYDPTHAVQAPAPAVRRRATGASGIRRPGRRRRTELDVDAIIEGYTGGQTINSIAVALRASHHAVRDALLAAGIELRNDRTRSGRPRTRPAPTPRRTLDEQAIVAAYLAGASAPTIAAEHGTGPATIRRILDRNGVQRRDDRATRSGGKRLSRDPGLVDRIRELYVSQQLTQTQVANIIGCSEKVIWRIVRDTPDITPHLSASARSAAGIGHPIKLQPEVHGDIIARYLAGQSGRLIAQAYDCTPPTVYAVLDKHGVARRPRGNFSPRRQDGAA